MLSRMADFCSKFATVVGDQLAAEQRHVENLKEVAEPRKTVDLL
jgi:hypothetical protein